MRDNKFLRSTVLWQILIRRAVSFRSAVNWPAWGPSWLASRFTTNVLFPPIVDDQGNFKRSAPRCAQSKITVLCAWNLFGRVAASVSEDALLRLLRCSSDRLVRLF